MPDQPDPNSVRNVPQPSADRPLPGVSAEHAELQRQGAKAAARGDSPDSNPMLESINQPSSTGESERVWSGRRDAWERGRTADVAAFSPDRAASGPAGHELDEALFGVTRVLTFSGNVGLTSASGFFFERDERLFLVTSRHVLFDAPTEHAPDRIEIGFHTDARDLTQLATLSILLHRDGLSVWRQAKDTGGEVDVAVLDLDRSAMPAGSVVQPFGPRHLEGGFDLFNVGDRLVIPGFPLGFFDTVHHLPVVRQAGIASSYGVRFQGQGYFLTDARMHRGSSGSPVLARAEPAAPGRPRWHLLGVHSSRMDMATRDLAQDESLGLNCAWYADVLMALTGRDPLPIG
ncbi:MAG TPA: serine protease [Rhizobacter sp.]